MDLWFSIQTIILPISSLLLALIIVPIVRKYAILKRLVDKPSDRKVHEKIVARLGGIGIFLSFFIILLIVMFIPSYINDFLILKEHYWIILFAIMIFLTGVFDDIKGLNAWIKLFVQIVVAVLVVITGTVIESLTLPFIGKFELGFLSYPFTILWIIGITNAVNLIDGLDGLAGGISFIVGLTLFFIALFFGHLAIALILLIFIGSLLGFLRYNFAPAKIFMGDSGSLFLGYFLSVFSIYAMEKSDGSIPLLTIIIVLAVPIFDTLIAFTRRILAKKSPFSADKEHIHHRIIRLGLTHKNTVILLYGFCLALGALAYFSVIFATEIEVLVLFVFIAIFVFILYRLGYIFNKKWVNRITEEEPNQIVYGDELFGFAFGKLIKLGYVVLFLGVVFSVSVAEIGKSIIVISFIILLIFKQIKLPKLRSSIIYLVISFLVVLVISTLLGDDIMNSFKKYPTYLSQILIFFITILYFRNFSNILPLFKILVVTSCFYRFLYWITQSY